MLPRARRRACSKSSSSTGACIARFKTGVARHLGQLEDYADVVHGLLQLYAATFAPRWLAAARALADDMIALFADPAGNGFFATGSDAPALLVRMRDLEDQPTPSGNSQAASVLVRLAGLTGRSDYLEQAERALAVVGDEVARVPLAFGTALGVIDRITRPRREIAIVGAPDDPTTTALVAVARDHAGPGDVIACGDPADAARSRPPCRYSPTAHSSAVRRPRTCVSASRAWRRSARRRRCVRRSSTDRGAWYRGLWLSFVLPWLTWMNSPP